MYAFKEGDEDPLEVHGGTIVCLRCKCKIEDTHKEEYKKHALSDSYTLVVFCEFCSLDVFIPVSVGYINLIKAHKTWKENQMHTPTELAVIVAFLLVAAFILRAYWWDWLF